MAVLFLAVVFREVVSHSFDDCSGLTGLNRIVVNADHKGWKKEVLFKNFIPLFITQVPSLACLWIKTNKAIWILVKHIKMSQFFNHRYLCHSFLYIFNSSIVYYNPFKFTTVKIKKRPAILLVHHTARAHAPLLCVLKFLACLKLITWTLYATLWDSWHNPPAP